MYVLPEADTIRADRLSLQAELETWDAALKSYDAEDFEKALDSFGVCPNSPLSHRSLLRRLIGSGGYVTSGSQTVQRY